MLLVVSMITGCGGQTKAPVVEEEEKTYTLNLGHVGPVDPKHSWNVYAYEFAEQVNKKTDGRVTINVFPAGQLGGDREMTEALQNGTMDLGLITTMTMGSFVPALQLWDLPYIFPPAYEKVDAILESEIGDHIAEEAEKGGFKFLAYWENDWRNVSNSKRPITTMDDLAGLKLRVPETPILIDWFGRAKVNVTPMAWPEVYTSLQQNVIDGQDNGITITYSARLYEVQKYYSLTKHVYSILAMIGSSEVWETLPEDIQQVLAETAKELAQPMRDYNRETGREWIKELEANGMAVNELSEETFADLLESAKPTYEKFEDIVGKEWIDKMLEWH
jgi:tripartite ATP-independent transporter DctP family solute receptor